MKTEFISQNEINLSTLTHAGEILRCGGLVVFPTETVYGLGANALDSTAAEKIYAAKGRPSDNPLIVHIASPDDAEKYAHIGEEYKRLSKAFMPGPLTVIMPKRNCIPSTVTGGLDSVGIRCPENKIARDLIKAAGVPIAAPSANISGKPSPTSAEHVKVDLDGKVDAIIDGGECTFGLESTIVKIENGKITLLRPGAITLDMLNALFDNVEVADAVTNKLSEDARPLSPGMKYRHYAPSAPLYLLNGSDEKRIAYCSAAGEDTLLLVFDEEAELFSGHSIITIGKRGDEKSQAKRLFAALREADATNCKKILAPMPRKSGIALALYNRMIRAAAHNIIDL
ncbi:MAG: threonylcarbamoyl-AMP synthase [Clostridia bacterium]|nr:threonylcarbamoyl-AMP synthase [Clostridia bacterium]